MYNNVMMLCIAILHFGYACCQPLNHPLCCVVRTLTNTVLHRHGYDADSMGYE